MPTATQTQLPNSVIEATVALTYPLSETVLGLELASPSGDLLPAWAPGAHIDLTLPNGITRQYSLCGDPEDLSRYHLGVLLEPQSRGGSSFVHDSLRSGDRVTISHPRNNFPLTEANEYHFIAGGVGITPIVAMVRAAEKAGASWKLTYMGRSRATMAFLDELSTMAPDRVTFAPQDEVGILELSQVIGAPSQNKLVYACGPSGLLGAIETHMAQGWPPSALKTERFVAKEIHQGQSKPFEVYLTSSDRLVQVQADQSILDAVELAGITPPYSCREGTCGTCETRIVSGSAEHLDSVLSRPEQDAQEYMMICVSRSGCPRLELEL